jgi:hypothetical protein
LSENRVLPKFYGLLSCSLSKWQVHGYTMIIYTVIPCNIHVYPIFRPTMTFRWGPQFKTHWVALHGSRTNPRRCAQLLTGCTTAPTRAALQGASFNKTNKDQQGPTRSKSLAQVHAQLGCWSSLSQISVQRHQRLMLKLDEIGWIWWEHSMRFARIELANLLTSLRLSCWGIETHRVYV